MPQPGVDCHSTPLAKPAWGRERGRDADSSYSEEEETGYIQRGKRKWKLVDMCFQRDACTEREKLKWKIIIVS